LTIRGRLTVALWQGRRAGSQIALVDDAIVGIDGDFGIGADTIVVAQSVVTKGVHPPRSLLVGNRMEVVESEFEHWQRDIEKSVTEMDLDDA
jgi:serine acetyltransferase